MLSENKTVEYDLALAYVNGSNVAIGELYVKYFPSLIMVAYKFTQNTEKSKDIVSMVFEKLINLNHLKRQAVFLHPTKGIYPLLVSIIKNKALDDLKQSKLHQEINQQIAMFTAIFSTNNAFNRFEAETISQLMGFLPKRENEILELHLQGFKNEEIAKQLFISYNTVRNTLHSAKQRIKKIWRIFM